MSVPTISNKWAVATVSLGKHQSHTLDRKIKSAHQNGFQGIELVYADLAAYAEQNGQSMVAAARQIRDLCASLSVEVLTLNPFKNFEGNLSIPLSTRLETAKTWIEIADAVGTKIIQMPSQFLDNSTVDESVIIPELRTLADLAAQSGLRIAYEAVAFAKVNGLWQDSVRIVEAVDRPNFGICLDSFHIHARIWGDPCAESGVLPGGPEALEKSMEEFLKTCPKEKVLYIQLSDASRFDPPLREDSKLFDGLEVKDPRLAWSRGCRPFPLEKPGYFPVVEIAKTWLLDYEWKGWVSLEVFLAESELEANGPEKMAERAKASSLALCSKLGIARADLL